MPNDKLTIEQFGQKIKSKYPQYQDMSDAELGAKMIEKFPEYKDMVVLDVKKKESTGLPSKVGTSGLPKSKADAIADNKSLGTPTGEQFTYAPEAFSSNEVKYAPTSKANPPKKPQPIVKPKEEFEYYTPDIYAEEVLYPKSQGVNPLTNKPNNPTPYKESKPTITNEEFSNRLKSVNTDLVSKEEEYAVPQLNYQFKDFGFTFEETGMLGDAMIVKAPNGKTTTINLEPTLGRFEKLEADKLQKFMKENSLQYDKLNKVVSEADNYNKTFNEQKDIDAAFSKIKQDQTDFAKSVQELYKLPKESEEYKTKLAELSKRQLQIENNKKELNKSVGQYVGMKSQQGETSEYLWNQLLEGITGTASGLVGLSIDAFAPETMTNEEKKKAKNWIQPIIRESLDFAKSESTTQEYAQNTGFIEGAIGGLVKSLPAMLSAEAMPLVMAGQISDDLDIEMDANPDFANISENEKLMLKAPLMIGGAVLETYGLRNAIGTKGLLNDLVANAISKSTKTTTAKSFKEFIEQDIENRLSKGLLKIGAGGLAEFETGASQELLDITTKDIYNAAKGKEMFQTPESLGEGAKQVIKAGLQEAIGGFILSTPSAFTKAKAKNDYTDVTDGQIEVLKALGNDVNVMDAIETNLQNQVATGEITAKEAEEQLGSFRETVGLMNSMDTESLSNEQIKESLPIVEEIKKLEKQKEGKVPIVKKVIQAQIDELNQKLLKATGQEKVKENKGFTFVDKPSSSVKVGDSVNGFTVQSIAETKNLKGEKMLLFKGDPKYDEVLKVYPNTKVTIAIPKPTVAETKQTESKSKAKPKQDVSKTIATSKKMQKVSADFQNKFNELAKLENEISAAETKKINEEFEARQKELSKYIPDTQEERDFNETNQLLDKATNEGLITSEVKRLNEIAYRPKGFSFDKEGNLVEEKTAKQKNKERVKKAEEAFKKKASNLQLGGLETLPEFTELVAAYIEMGYLSAKEILQKFREDLEGFAFDEKIATDKINEILAKEGIGTKSETKEDSGKVKKKVATERAFEGTVREEIKKYIEDEGLYRDKFSFEQRSEQANKLIEDIGIDNAIEGVKNGDIRGALATAVITKAIKINDDEMAMLKATDVEELDVLGKRAADLIALLEQESYYGGEATGYLAYAYLNEDIGYNVEVKINEYKAANNGEISPEVEQKFRDINKQLEEVNKKLLEAEARAKKAEEDNMIASIKESAAREKKKASTKIRKETDYIVQKIREGKTNRPSMFMSATPASLVWDGALETVASTIKATGRSVEAIAKGIEYIKSSDWYSSLSFDDKDEAIKQFQEYWKEGKKPKIVDGKIKIPQSLIRDLVEGGIDNIDDLVSEVMAMMQEEYPNVTERQIRDAISEYGKTKSYTKDDIAKQIRKIKHVGRIVSSLEDVAAKKRPLRSGLQRDKLDTEERALMKELREAMKELPIDVELEAEQMKTATDAAKTRLINQIEDLQREIDRKEQVPRKVRTIKDDQEIIELKAKRDAVKAEHEAIFKDEEYQLAKRLELTKKSAERRIEELKRRIAEGDFVKKVKKPIIADSELTKLRAQKIRLQSEYEKEIYKAKILNRTKAQKWKDGVWDAWGLLRLLQATGEFSFVGIQGLIYATSHPIQSARAFKKAIQLLFSESKTEKWLNEIKAQEYYPMVKASKLALSEPHAEITAREELFYSDSANSAWNLLGLGLRLKSKSAYDKWKDLSPFKGFERASVGYLDTIRLQRFLDGVEILKAKGIYFDENPKAYKELADVINTFTGRASIGAAEPIAPLLTKVFFSPRNWASMIKTATPYAFYHFGKMRAGGEGFKPTVQQKMALMDFSKFVGLTTSMVILAATYLNGDDDDETSVETDPRSSDFGKIKIGRTRVDPWGGRIQQIVLMSKFMMGEVKDKEGKIVPLGVPYKTPTRLGLIGQIAANKLSPSASLVKEYLSTRKDADGNTVTEYGEPYSIKDKFYEKLLPIYISTVKELLAEDPTALDGLLAFYAYFGGGVNVYDKPKVEPKKRTLRKLREESELNKIY